MNGKQTKARPRESISEQFDREVIAEYESSNPIIVLWFQEIGKHFTSMSGAWDGYFEAVLYTLMETLRVLRETNSLPTISQDIYERVQTEWAADDVQAKTMRECIRAVNTHFKEAVFLFETILEGLVPEQKIKDYLYQAMMKLLRMIHLEQQRQGGI